MRLFIILLLFVSLSPDAHAKGNNAPSALQDSVTIKKLLADIAKDNVFEPEATPEAASLQVKRGQLLNRQSPFELLRICMENPNAVVRLYAFKALADKMDNLPEEAVSKFKADTTPVTIHTANGKKQLPVWQVANGFLK